MTSPQSPEEWADLALDLATVLALLFAVALAILAIA